MKKIKLQITSATDYDASFVLSVGRETFVGGYAIGSDAQGYLDGLFCTFFPEFECDGGWAREISVPTKAATKFLDEVFRIYAKAYKADKKMSSDDSYVCTFEFCRVN